MSRIWAVVLSFLLAGPALSAQAPVHIALFDSPVGTEHGDQVQQVLQGKLASCTVCRVTRYGFFQTDGRVDHSKFLQQLKDLPARTHIVHISWNLPYDSRYYLIVAELKRLISKGVKVVAASGESQDPSHINREIKDTVMGRVEGVILVGELNKKGRLPIRAFYGPQITKSYPSIEGHPGSSFTSLIETARIAIEMVNKGR